MELGNVIGKMIFNVRCAWRCCSPTSIGSLDNRTQGNDGSLDRKTQDVSAIIDGLPPQDRPENEKNPDMFDKLVNLFGKCRKKAPSADDQKVSEQFPSATAIVSENSGAGVSEPKKKTPNLAFYLFGLLKTVEDDVLTLSYGFSLDMMDGIRDLFSDNGFSGDFKKHETLDGCSDRTKQLLEKFGELYESILSAAWENTSRSGN